MSSAAPDGRCPAQIASAESIARCGDGKRPPRIIRPMLPAKPCGVARVDARRVLNSIFRVMRTVWPGGGVLEGYGFYTAVYNRFNRWAKAGGGMGVGLYGVP